MQEEFNLKELVRQKCLTLLTITNELESSKQEVLTIARDGLKTKTTEELNNLLDKEIAEYTARLKAEKPNSPLLKELEKLNSIRLL